ncbi:uncharacterized protein [Triticum aestivum]|uniref:uncharacterized protein n=1 Tax=Triticum aestivum TaxID=4565 RepID=UPI001D02D258|nr:uncharacterized protein LOC123112429 [Triticum aestivum]
MAIPPPPPPPPPFRPPGTNGAPPTPLRAMPPLVTPAALAQGTLLARHDSEASSSISPSPLAGVFINQHVPVVLSLNPPNFSQWRTLFEVQFQKSGVVDHIAGPPRPSDPTWLQDDAHVVSWLYNRISPEVFGLVHQRGARAAAVWESICVLFLENREHQLVLLAMEFRRIEQGSSSILSYFARLKECADRLADLGERVTDRDQVLNMIRGLHPRYRYAVPILTMQSPFPTLLQCRAFLLLEESRNAEETQPDIALHAGRAPTPAPAGGGGPGDHSNRSNGGGRGGGRHRGRGRGSGSGGGQSSNHGGGGAPPRPAAPNSTPWTGLVHAWPMPWRPHAPGAGILGLRPGGPAPFAGMAAHSWAPPPPAGAPPTYWQPGAVPPHPLYGATNAPSGIQAPAWDQAALVHALNAMSLQQGQSSNSGGEWVLDSGASSHMAASPGPKNEGGDPPL